MGDTGDLGDLVILVIVVTLVMWVRGVTMTCSECQQDVRKTEIQADRHTDRLTERQIEDRKTFQLSYQNKSCQEYQQDIRKIDRDNRMSERQKHRLTDRQKDR